MLGAILCGGYGKRLKPLTDGIPKPLIEIGDNYTILDKQLSQFRNAGVTTVFLLAGYMHEKIEERFGEKWDGLRINYLIEDKPRGTLYAIANLMEKIGEDVIIRNGDIVTEVNLEKMIKNHRDGEMSMFITPLVSPFGITELQDGKITGFKEKPVLDYYLNAGIYIVSRNLFHLFEKKEGSVEREVFPQIARQGMLNYFKDDVFWHSVDSMKDLESVREKYADRHIAQKYPQ